MRVRIPKRNRWTGVRLDAKNLGGATMKPQEDQPKNDVPERLRETTEGQQVMQGWPVDEEEQNKEYSYPYLLI